MPWLGLKIGRFNAVTQSPDYKRTAGMESACLGWVKQAWWLSLRHHSKSPGVNRIRVRDSINQCPAVRVVGVT